MRRSVFIFAMAVVFFTATAMAQSHQFQDRIQVEFQNPVVINDTQTLSPGTYNFEQIESPAQPNVFRVYDQQGKTVGTTAVASDAVWKGSETTTVPQETKVVIAPRADGKFYLDEIWFHGQNRGYEFDIAEGRAGKMDNQTSGTQQTTTTAGTQDTTGTSADTTADTQSTTMARTDADEMPQADMDQSSDKAKNAQKAKTEVKLVGCVTGPLGGSYMLTTKDNLTYTLRGDYDEVREDTAHMVTVYGVPRPDSSKNTQNNQSATTGTASAGTQVQPVLVEVTTVQPMPETCDTGTRQ